MGIQAEFGKMNIGFKICAGVCCCLVSVLAIFGVVFLAALPLLTGKVAPFMAQAALGMGSLNISNATVWMPSNISAFPWAEQIVHAQMSNPGPFSVTLKSFTQKMVMRGNFSFLTDETNVTIATYEFPEIHLKPGDNDVDVKVNMTLASDNCGRAPYPCFQVFQSYAAYVSLGMDIPGYNLNSAYMTLEGEDMKVKALGLTVKGSYSSVFKMSCKVTGEPEMPLNTSLEPACQIPGNCAAPASLGCWMVADFLPVTTTTTTTEAPSEELLL